MPAPITRRRFLRDGSAVALGLTLSPPWRGEAALGSIAGEQGRRVVEVSGLHVAPGFIDIHSHSDSSILAYPGAESRVLQGVTTEVTGNCGHSVAPLEGVDAEARRAALLQDDGIEATWGSVRDYFDRLEQVQVAANQILLLGQGTLRENAIGNIDRPLTPEETKRVVRAVEVGMDHGAFGLSTGLEYTPGNYTPTDEIVAMTRVVARRGGFYASHIRNEEAGLLEAVDEATEIGQRTGARVQVSHLKAAGKPNWSKQRAALDLIAAARAAGVEVLADAYPYTAYSTGLTILLETWAREGDEHALVARLRDPETRRRIRGEAAARVHNDPGGYDLIVISRVRTEKNRATVGMNLAEIAETWSVDPVDALLRLLEEESGSVSFVGHGMSEANVEMVLAHPLVMIGSDGVSMAPVGKAAETRPHPRSYGAFPRVLQHYVRDRQLFDLPTAIRKMTSMPADQVGLRDRGRLARGQKADLVVFDAGSVEDRATFEKPHQYAGGIVHVLVNGRFAMEQGRHTEARAGTVLRKS
jgi:N-acyl-D-amino-acid deacylase